MVRSTGKNLGWQPPDWSEAEAWETEWIEESVAGRGDDLRGDVFLQRGSCERGFG
jgi:hypothetical protein